MRVSLIVTAALLLAPGPALAQKAGTTRDQFVGRAAAQFQKLDADKDGKVTADELTAGGKAKRAQRMMKQDDTNGDGILTVDEMTAAAGARFDKRDANHNGTIDADEAPAKAGQ
jgi:hypothetical protein